MKALKILVVISLFFTACKTAKYHNLENGLYADIQTNKGDILIKLYKENVPMTVANFVSLAEGNNPKLADSLQGKPFYNGIKFHRVIKDFMIQGGDPKGTGAGNAGYRFADEIPVNDEGDLLHKHNSKGILSMANSGKNTNSSQFFITHKATPWLDGKHSVFGKVKLGQNIVDTIQQNDYINKVDIIRVGTDARKFDAPKVFETELANVTKKEEERKQKLLQAKENFKIKMGINDAVATESGLKILSLKEGAGKKVNPALQTLANYEIYLDSGKKLDSSIDKGVPFPFVLDEMDLIAGWKEGVKTMKVGDKKRFFIPYYLGYGERDYGPIPGKSDLILEVEILKVGK